MRDRVAWIDSLKGIGIILVIVGHCSGHTRLLFRYIYSFHMPLFFFAAGYLLDPRRYGSSWQFIKKKTPGRIVPYVLFSLLSYGLYLAATSIKTGLPVSSILSVDGFQPYVIQPVIGLALADRSWLDKINNITLWFLPCLLLAESVHFVLQRAMTGRAAPALLPALAGISFAAYTLSGGLSRHLPWSLETALVSALFYGVGSRMRELSGKWEAIVRGQAAAKYGIFALLVVLSVWSSLIRWPGAGNAVFAYARYALAAFAGIGAAVFIAHWTAGFMPLRFFGRNSLLLLGLHLELMTWSMKLIDAASGLITSEEIVVSENVLASMIVAATLAVSVPVIAAANWLIPRFARAGTAVFGTRS